MKTVTSMLNKSAALLVAIIFLLSFQATAIAAEETTSADIPVFVGDVVMIPDSGGALVLLVTEEKDRYLPITIGHFEATAILRSLQSISTPRPMTHDLILHAVSAMGGQVISISVTSLEEGTFKAAIQIGLENGSRVSLDARPSDSIAIAVRAGAAIFVAPSVMEQAGRPIKKDEEDTGRPSPEVPEAPLQPPRVAPETIL